MENEILSSIEHFGVWVREKESGLRLTRENYATISTKPSFPEMFRFLDSKNETYKDETTFEYKDSWCEKHYEQCMENFDLNMLLFSNLDPKEFNEKLNAYVKSEKFHECFDLKKYDGKEGCYILVLDQYCQAYVGTTSNIKTRVMSHWSKKKSFDRLLFPISAVTESVLSIDSFRALDTTRIFVRPEYNASFSEHTLVKKFPPKFLCNRISGGSLEEILYEEGFIIPRKNEFPI